MAFDLPAVMLERLERELGRSLPVEYRNRLLRENGGELPTEDEMWWLYPVFDDTDQRRTKRSANHVLRETAEARNWRSFPPDALAIAANGSGDLLVLLPLGDRPEYQSEVYRWAHETGACERMDGLDFGAEAG